MKIVYSFITVLMAISFGALVSQKLGLTFPYNTLVLIVAIAVAVKIIKKILAGEKIGE